MLNVQLGTCQRKRGRTHLPALLIHVLETQPATGSTSSVRALGEEEAVHEPCVIPPDTSLRLQHPGVAVLSCSCPVPKVPCWCAAPRTASAPKAHGCSLFQHPAEANSHKVPASHMLIIFPTFFFW